MKGKRESPLEKFIGHAAPLENAIAIETTFVLVEDRGSRVLLFVCVSPLPVAALVARSSTKLLQKFVRSSYTVFPP